MTEKPLILSIQDLSVRFNLRGRVLHAIRGLSLDVHAGESLAIVGESGCGKSVLNKNLIGLLDSNGFIDGGSIRYYGIDKNAGVAASLAGEDGNGYYVDLTKFQKEKDWLKIRGKEICMILQDPMTSFEPAQNHRCADRRGHSPAPGAARQGAEGGCSPNYARRAHRRSGAPL